MEANTWLFGNGYGIDFNCNPPRPINGSATKNSPEGVSAISDACGDLVFYSNGDTLFNLSHKPYFNPILLNLNGSKLATQSSLIIPNPDNPTTHYLFTIDSDEAANLNGLSYCELNGGIAASVSIANKVLARTTTEMITACDAVVTAGNPKGVWVIVKSKKKSEFKVFKVTGAGIDSSKVVVSTAGSAGSESGQMKVSPDGSWIAIRQPLQIFKFDASTGTVSNFITDFSGISTIDSGNSVEFSPDGTKLYFNNFGGAAADIGYYQLTMSSDTDAVKNSLVKISIDPNAAGGLQVAPDGRIYVMSNTMGPRVGVIRDPNEAGTACHFVDNSFFVGAGLGNYFPTFNQSYFLQRDKAFQTEMVCFGDSTHFQPIPSYWDPIFPSIKIDSVVWDYGDPNSGTQNRQVSLVGKHVFSAPGCYRVNVTYYSQVKQHSSQMKIRINKLPTLDIGPRDTSLCIAPRVIYFFASTADNPDASYEWFYYPIDTSGISNPDPPPPNPIGNDYFTDLSIEGQIAVKKTWKCCEAYDTIDVFHDSIEPVFRVNDNLQCERDNKFVYKNISKPNFGATQWDFGNGKKATGDSGITHYTAAGAYYPKMTTWSKKGCKGSLTRIMLVVKHPQARFFADTAEQCQRGNVFKLRDSSTIEYGQGSLEKWQFDLGDSSKTTLKQFTKTYKNFGDYTVSLVVTSSQECRDTARMTLKVYEQPKAGFSVNDRDQCLSANNFIIDDTSTAVVNLINKRIWTFGDGAPAIDRQGQPLQFSHNYSNVDSFLLTLRVATGIGCFDSVSSYVRVHGDPYVDFKIDKQQQCQDGNVFNFTDTTHTEKGFVQTLLWDFGDGSPISNSGLGKSYNQYGAFNIKLRAITNKGCTDSTTHSILIHPMPNAGFTISDSAVCFKNHSFTFSAAPSFIPVGNIATYSWDFGDQTTSLLKDPPTKVYAKDSMHLVKLLVISDQGCKDSARKFVKFYPTPVAVATVDKKVQCIEENVFYYSAVGSAAPGGTIADYLWELGDGTIEQSITPGGKFYIKSDTFDINLKVTTDMGCTDTASLQVIVLPSPQANFEVTPTCLFQPSFFTDKSTSTPGKITRWNWKFGDGMQDTAINPVHTYGNTGAYTVTLNVLSDFGCEATAVKINEAIVKALPQAKFSHTKVDYDEKNTTIQFNDESIDVDEWLWDLGKGNITNSQNPLVVYDDTATIPVKLIVKNDEGCFDTTVEVIFVAPEYIFNVPSAFTPNKDFKNPTFGGEGTLYFKEYYLAIYNRWGQMVFEATTPVNKWDGTYNGEPCPDGMYTYVYRIRDVFGYYHNYKGQLTLLR